ncbi:hypothetical protein PSH83_11490 [Pseudomonas beijingensis]|nr:hypothetical protein [Pseudomonas sp. FP2262]WLH48497.1 hypothetical protein PSH83_11490 [Pseudomonas sp. FP2262]
MQETVEASGITPQPGLLTANQAQVGHLSNHFRLAWHRDQAAARPYREVQSSCVNTLLKLAYQRVVQRPGSDGNLPSRLLLSGNTQVASQYFARAATLGRISEHALRVVFFPSGEQGAYKVFAIWWDGWLNPGSMPTSAVRPCCLFYPQDSKRFMMP